MLRSGSCYFLLLEEGSECSLGVKGEFSNILCLICSICLSRAMFSWSAFSFFWFWVCMLSLS